MHLSAWLDVDSWLLGRVLLVRERVTLQRYPRLLKGSEAVDKCGKDHKI
jgi:hypothetical protein